MTAKVQSYDAFFLHKKNGKVLPVKCRHILTILDSPTTYGLNKKKIIEEYIKNGETVGSEGQTRNAVVLQILKNDYSRIRYWQRNALWRIQIYEELNDVLRKNILNFCQKLNDGSIRDGLQRSNANGYQLEIHSTIDTTLFFGTIQEAIVFLSE